MATTRWSRRPEIDAQAFPRVARLICSWSVDIRKPLGRVRSSSFRTKLLPRPSWGVMAQVMWYPPVSIRRRRQTPDRVTTAHAGRPPFAVVLHAVCDWRSLKTGR